jgi:integrase
LRGHIRKRGKASWQIAVSAGFDPVTGKRSQIFRTVKGTKKDAERELTRLLREVDGGTFADSGRLTLAAYLARYLEHAGTRVRASTLQRYRELMHRHVLPRIGRVPLAKLQPVHVQAVLDEMLAQGLAPRTVVQAYRVLSAALRQAVKWQLLALNPAAAASPPRPERPRLTIPDSQAVARLLEEASGEAAHIPLILAASTGMRRGEVLGLRWSAVDLDAGLIRVVSTLQRIDGRLQQVEPKTDRSRRTVALPNFALEVLRAHRKEQAARRLLVGPAWVDLDLVVDRGEGRPMDPGHLSHAFGRIARRAGLQGLRLHDLRHAYATALLAAGVHPKIVSEALGHASVGFTMDVYSHVLPTMQEQAAKAIQAALRSRCVTGLLGVARLLPNAD